MRAGGGKGWRACAEGGQPAAFGRGPCVGLHAQGLRAQGCRVPALLRAAGCRMESRAGPGGERRGRVKGFSAGRLARTARPSPGSMRFRPLMAVIALGGFAVLVPGPMLCRGCHAVPAACGGGSSWAFPRALGHDGHFVQPPFLTCLQSCLTGRREPSRGGLSMTTANAIAPSRELRRPARIPWARAARGKGCGGPCAKRGAWWSKPV